MGQSIGLTVDNRRDEPIYRQIFDQVVARIRTNAFPPGFKLPPTRVLSEALGTHRNTVARAYADLERAGFVSSSVGRGTFVAVSAPPAEPVSKEEAPNTMPADTMPWRSLLSRAVQSDAVARSERFARRDTRRDVINLGRMQPSPDLVPHALMRRCLERVLTDHGARAMIYAPPDGVPRLREQIALDLCARGVPASADDVLVTSGSQQGIDLLARALVDPGDTVLVDTMTYSGAIELFTLAGARLVTVPTDDEGPDLSALQRVMRADVKAFYLMPNGHNPTGLTVSAERRRALSAWSRANRIPLIEDDYGAGLSLDDGDSPPSLRSLDGDTIYVSTFSKRLIPALRIGFVVAPRALRPTLCTLKRAMDLGTSTILQHGLAEFMERGYLRAHMNRVLAEYRVRRDTLETALRKALPSDVRWVRPRQGVVLWVRLPERFEPEEVFAEALRHGVQVSPAPVYTAGGQAERGFRLTFCAEPQERLVEGARRLGKALKALGARSPRAGGADAVVEVA